MRPLMQPQVSMTSPPYRSDGDRSSGGSSKDFLRFSRSGSSRYGDSAFDRLPEGGEGMGSYAVVEPELVEVVKGLEWNGILVTKTWSTNFET